MIFFHFLPILGGTNLLASCIIETQASSKHGAPRHVAGRWFDGRHQQADPVCAGGSLCRVRRPAYSALQCGLSGRPVRLFLLRSDPGLGLVCPQAGDPAAASRAADRNRAYAAAVFLVVTLVQFVMGFVADSGVSHTNDWKSCWNAANQ